MTTAAEWVYDLEFPPSRRDRSPAYKAGALDALLWQLDGCGELPRPFAMGSTEADAYELGFQRGAELAAELRYGGQRAHG